MTDSSKPKGTLLQPPLTEETVRSLQLGQTVFLSGVIYTFRDAQHMRAAEFLERGEELPVDLGDQVIYHAGPAFTRDGSEVTLFTAGPTTSARNNMYAPQLLRELKFRAMVGKGGMDEATLEAMKEVGCVYLLVPSISAVLTTKVKGVREVYWEDLLGEAIFGIEVAEFGPLVVAMTADGESMFEQVTASARARLAASSQA